MSNLDSCRVLSKRKWYIFPRMLLAVGAISCSYRSAKYVLCSAPLRELLDLCGRQEVHHRLVTHFQRKQLRYVHVPAPSHFPASFPPNYFLQFPLLVLPPLTVAKENSTTLQTFLGCDSLSVVEDRSESRSCNRLFDVTRFWDMH